jgi:hypothetical protein
MNIRHKNDKIILCACGCGAKIKEKDKYGRLRKYISGHNTIKKYDDPTQYKREWNHRNQESRYTLKIKRGYKLKKEVVIMSSGKCKKCGISYDGKNGCIFQFHHKKPHIKCFPINIRTLINFSWEKIKIEIKKCVLLCANCHFQIHNKEY